MSNQSRENTDSDQSLTAIKLILSQLLLCKKELDQKVLRVL